jgi:hypothetical protein
MNGVAPTRWRRPSRRGWHERARASGARHPRRRPARSRRMWAARRLRLRTSGRWQLSIARNGAGRSSAAVASARTIWFAERGGALVGCLPLIEVRSPLFGNAFVASGFATGGGILADSDEVARRWARRAGRSPGGTAATRSSFAAVPCPRAGPARRAPMPISTATCPATARPCSRRCPAASAPKSGAPRGSS